MNFPRTLMALWVILLLKPQITKAEPNILAIGDSLTYGLGVASDKSWPSLLEKRLRNDGFAHAKVINAGSSGATTAYGPSALNFHLKRSKPHLIIYALGANDGLRALAPSSTQKNIEDALEIIAKEKIKVIVLGMKAPPNYGTKFPKDFETSFVNATDKFKVPFIPFYIESVAGIPTLNQPDGIHPNELGYQKIIDKIYPKIKALL